MVAQFPFNPLKKGNVMVIQLRPKAHPAYRSLPILGPVVDDFSDWAQRCGYELKSFRSQLGNIRYLAHFLHRRGLQSLRELKPLHFDAAWAQLRKKNRGRGCTVRQVQRFLQQVHGLVRGSSAPATRSESELSRYAEYLQRVRGFAEHTIASHMSCLRAFLKFIGYERSASAITNLAAERVESFVHAQAKICNRFSLQHVVGCLRGFLRFQYAEGKLLHPLHTAIDTPRVYRFERLPRALPWPQVQALLRSVDCSQPHGLRDYTMLFLMAGCGLRSSEVVAFTLDDIDWRAGVLRIPQCKTHQHLVLPLTDEVGNVLQRYLKKGRRPSQRRELFLRMHAPFDPLDSTSVHDIFNYRLRCSGLNLPAQGTYCLRHAFAVRLLRQGVSLKTIGDTLGHRDPESTAVYLRLAVDDLRDVGLPVPRAASTAVLPKVDGKSRLPRVRFRTGPYPSPPAGFRSGLGASLQRYIATKQALGRRFGNEARVLLDWDAFLHQRQGRSKTVGSHLFNRWAKSLERLSPSVRRHHLRIVRNFLLFQARHSPLDFIPDLTSFPHPSPPRPPRLVSSSEMARVLATTTQLKSSSNNPLRAQTVRTALLLLFCCGLRRGELLRLRLAHFDPEQNLLRIEATKFNKSRIVPLSKSVGRELHDYLELRHLSKLPAEKESFLFWSPRRRESATYAGDGLSNAWRQLCLMVDVLDKRGRPPRLHDLRHSFIIERLQHWYAEGETVSNKLIHLSFYVGHVSPASTHYYLQLTPQLRDAANRRFHQSVTPLFEEGGLR
jgi:integrase/recombinase XerD